MSFWIETNVKSLKTTEGGVTKKVNEPYLVNALTFTEAEARVTDEMQQCISEDFTVTAVKKSNISEIFHSTDGDLWYKAKLAFISVNEKTGTEKRENVYYLVQASDFHGALRNITKEMNGTMMDYVILSIVETKIVDVLDIELD